MGASRTLNVDLDLELVALERLRNGDPLADADADADAEDDLRALASLRDALEEAGTCPR